MPAGHRISHLVNHSPRSIGVPIYGHIVSEWRNVLGRSWNYERTLVFDHIIINKSLDVNGTDRSIPSSPGGWTSRIWEFMLVWSMICRHKGRSGRVGLPGRRRRRKVWIDISTLWCCQVSQGNLSIGKLK